jgi:FkbM family methyltransferase
MKVNYFDFGLFDGEEINMFLNDIKDFNVDVNVYGFEANPIFYEKIKNRFIHNNKIKIYNLAISDKNEKVKLYLEKTGQGNSIFRTKNNVDPNNYYTVDGISFVDWLNDNLPNFVNDINIVRFNIEGAELLLINDMISKNVVKYFSLFLGSHIGVDILKVSEIQKEYQNYLKTLKDNKIEIKLYCKDLKNENVNLKEELKKILKKV